VLAPSCCARKFDRPRHGEGEGGSCVFSGRSAEWFEMFFCHEG
jgi:hypothetical protein